jgi:hypothetical protein
MEVSGAGERMRTEPNLYKQLLAKQLDPTTLDSIMLGNFALCDLIIL